MKKVTSIYLLTLIILVCACNKKETLTKIDVDKQLADMARSFNGEDDQTANKFCSLFHVDAYDKIVVIAPYTSANDFRLKREGIENLEKIKDTILSVSFDEGKCMLVYIKNKNGVAYSEVARWPVDIVGIKQQGSFSFSHHQCGSFTFKKSKADGRLSMIRF